MILGGCLSVKRLKNWLGDQLRTEIEVIAYSQKTQSKTTTYCLKDFFYTSLPLFIKVTFS